MGRLNLTRLGRRTKNTIKKIGTIVRKGASVVRGIIGNVDKISGGGLSKMISSDPRGMLLLGGVEQLADRDKQIMMREQLKRNY
jgi:hypothetical protein